MNRVATIYSAVAILGHIHTREDESWAVIEGELLFDAGEEQIKRFPNQDGVFREELEKIQAKYGARPARGWKPASHADNPR